MSLAAGKTVDSFSCNNPYLYIIHMLYFSKRELKINNFVKEAELIFQMPTAKPCCLLNVKFSLTVDSNVFMKIRYRSLSKCVWFHIHMICDFYFI